MIRTAAIITIAICLFLAPGATAKTAYPIELKKSEPRTVLCKRIVTTRAALGRDLNQAHQELGRYLKAKKVTVAGPPLAIYHSPPGPKWRIDACLPPRTAVTASGPFRLQKLADGPVAILTHRGAYHDLTPVYLALWKWINHQGYQPAGPPREVYVAMPPRVKDPKKFVTLIVWPVKKVRCSPK
ncbi:MAG: GyrI-like domain-containing protein [Proteobacteria bacterium]|nr:GyrI-like domain-containing protein [Pseudomonadota bacterium]MBU1740818.1 GyrI-like domain-containing protein [Pseudomonadota bacterium]